MNLYAGLLARHGKQGWWPLSGVYASKNAAKRLTDDERFEISVGAILTQNASWRNVEAALENLREVNMLNKDAVLRVDSKRLAHLIRTSVYHNQKAKKLKVFAQFLDEGRPITRENLLGLWGVGQETADSILLYAYKKPVFVVDAYTKRVCISRGVLQNDASYDEVQGMFMRHLPRDYKLFNEFHALFVAEAKGMKSRVI